MYNNQFHGYNFRVKQPCILMNQDFRLEGSVDIVTIDKWLSDVIRIEDYRFPEKILLNGNADRHNILMAAGRALVLYSEILTGAGFPSYEPGRVMRIEPIEGQPDCHRATIALPVIDNVPLHHFTDAFAGALGVVLERFKEAPTPETTEDVLVDIKERIVDTLEQAIPFTTGNTAILDMAYKQNVPFRHLGGGIVRIGWGAKSHLMQHTASEADSAAGAFICGNKVLSAHILGSVGLPVAEHAIVLSAEDAVAAAERFGWPVVVKPTDRERSQGVTINITDRDALIAAYELARGFSGQVLVERQITGVCHRIQVAFGKMIFVVKRNPKGVDGDGEHSVVELVEMFKADQMQYPPWVRMKLQPLDDIADTVLAAQGLTRDSVPEAGRRVDLREIPSDEWGGEIVNMTSEIHPDNVRLALEAAKALGLAIVGVDLMSTDISKPWHENGAIINEMNFRPQFMWQRREKDAATVIPAMFEADGRIPVHLVTGEGDLLAEAKRLKAEFARQGRKCHLASGRYTEDAEGEEIRMRGFTLFERCLALTLRPEVEGIIMAGTAPELARRGFAVDRLETAHVVTADEKRAKAMLRELRARIAIGSCHRIDPAAERKPAFSQSPATL